MTHQTLHDMEQAFDLKQLDGYAWLESPGVARKSIVLVHGVTGGKEDMLPLALKYQANGYKVYCVDLPGHGKSKWHNQTTFAELSDWLEGYLKRIGMPDVLVSNSFSSAILYAYLQHHILPSTTQVLFACPTPRISRLSRNMYMISKFAPIPLAVSWWLYTCSPANRIRAAILGKSTNKSAKMWLQESEKRKRSAVLGKAGMGMSTMLFADNPYDGPKLSERTQRQMTVILGTKDNVVTTDTPQVLNDLLPASAHVSAPGAGHILHFEAIDKYSIK